MIAWPIITLIIFILFMLYLGWAFFFTVFELAINGAVLYLLFLRAYTEIVKEKKYYFYLGGAVVSMLVYLLLGNFLSALFVWPITTFLVLSWVFAQIGHYTAKKYYKK